MFFFSKLIKLLFLDIRIIDAFQIQVLEVLLFDVDGKLNFYGCMIEKIPAAITSQQKFLLSIGQDKEKAPIKGDLKKENLRRAIQEGQSKEWKTNKNLNFTKGVQWPCGWHAQLLLSTS